MSLKTNYKVELKCVFCRAKIFELPYEGYQPISGDMIRCAICGNSNDYTSLRRTAISKTVATIQDDVCNEVKKIFKKAGFKVK